MPEIKYLRFIKKIVVSEVKDKETKAEINKCLKLVE